MLSKFDLAAWRRQVSSAHSIFHALDKYVSDPSAMSAYLEKRSEEIRQVFHDDSPGPTSLATFFNALEQKDIANAAGLYRRQMIVVAATLLETMLRDFLILIFLANPIRMQRVLEDPEMGDRRRSFSLKQLVNARSRKALLAELAETSAARISTMRFPAMFNVFTELINATPKRVTETAIAEIVEQRNRIVHEASQEPVSSGRVTEVFKQLFDLTEDLAEIAPGNDIDVEGPAKVDDALGRVMRRMLS